MPTVDQLQELIPYLFVGSCIGVFSIGTTLFILWIIDSKAGPRRRISRHRKGAQFHRSTYVPVNIESPHPHEPVSFLQAHVRRTTSVIALPVTEVMPKIKVEVKHADIRR